MKDHVNMLGLDLVDTNNNRKKRTVGVEAGTL